MANEIAVALGSFALDSTNSIALSDIEIKVAKAVREYELPKFNGSVIPIGKRKNMTLTFKGSIIGSNYDALRTNLDSLKNAIEGTAEKNFAIDDDRIVKVQYRNFTQIYKTLRTFASFSFDVVASDPFWYAAALTTVNQSWTTGVNHTVANNGNAKTRVKVTITAGATPVTNDIILENTTTGEIFKFRGTVAANKALIVNNKMDATDLSVTNDGADAIRNWIGSFITLAAGNNSLKLTSAVSSLALTYEYRDCYF